MERAKVYSQTQCQSKRKKNTIAVIILHLFMWLSHTEAFQFGSSSRHAKRELVKSPCSQSSVFIS